MRSNRPVLALALLLLLAIFTAGNGALAQSTKPFKIKATAGKGGTVTPRSATVAPGADQRFDVNANSGFFIASVAVDRSNQPVPAGATSYSYTFTNVQAKHSLKASFSPFTYPVTVDARDGISVSPGSKSYTAGSKVKFTIKLPSGGGTILATLDGRPISLSRAGKNFTYTLTVTGPHTLVFTLDRPKQALTVSRAGSGSGSVTSSPTGIDCGSSCTASFDAGTLVTLTAVPAQGSTFAGWAGDCSGSGACSVTMSAARSVTATFNAIPVQHTLTVSATPEAGGSVTSDPAGISCGAGNTLCAKAWPAGTAIALTPMPSSGWSFTGWTGACSGTGACAVTLNADTTVGASFAQAAEPTLTVTVTPDAGGAVVSDPSGISCGAGNTQCAKTWPAGTAITLTPTPSSGWNFSGWTGACSGTGACAVTLNADTTVGVSFTEITPKRTLSVNVNAGANAAGGHVSSTPAGIDCGTGSTACSAQWDQGTQVSLAAQPSTGWTFAGWSGACSGTGSCTVTLNADATVGATFTEDQGGGSPLAVKVIDVCGASVPGAMVVVHNTDGSVKKTLATDANGIVDLSAESKPLTFTVGRPNSTVEDDMLTSFVDVPGGVGTLLVPLGGEDAACPDTDPSVGSVTVTLTPQPVFGRVQPFDFTSALWMGPKQYEVKQHHLQSDGKLTLLGDNSSVLDSSPPSYGFLLDQAFSNGASYTIDLNRTASSRLFNALDPVTFVSVTGTRLDQGFDLGLSLLPSPATSGQFSFFDEFPAENWITSASANFFPSNGDPTSFATYTLVSGTPPASTIQIPGFIKIDPFSYSGGLLSWGLDEPQPVVTNKVGRAWFSNKSSTQPTDERIWQIVLDPNAHGSWRQSNLTLPPELAMTGRTENSALLYVTQYSAAASYGDALKLFFAGGGPSPAMPFSLFMVVRSPAN